MTSILQRRERKLSGRRIHQLAGAAVAAVIFATPFAILPACESMPNGNGAASTATNDYTGTLRAGAVAIGGETTGWTLKRRGEPDLEVDVSDIATEAESLAGLLVRIRGRVQQRNYVERGRVPVLVAERIELAN